MSSLETVIESYTEHIFAKDILRYLVDRINKLVASMTALQKGLLKKREV